VIDVLELAVHTWPLPAVIVVIITAAVFVIVRRSLSPSTVVKVKKG
jgi:hypothetical protein